MLHKSIPSDDSSNFKQVVAEAFKGELEAVQRLCQAIRCSALTEDEAGEVVERLQAVSHTESTPEKKELTAMIAGQYLPDKPLQVGQDAPENNLGDLSVLDKPDLLSFFSTPRDIRALALTSRAGRDFAKECLSEWAYHLPDRLLHVDKLLFVEGQVLSEAEKLQFEEDRLKFRELPRMQQKALYLVKTGDTQKFEYFMLQILSSGVDFKLDFEDNFGYNLAVWAELTGNTEIKHLLLQYQCFFSAEQLNIAKQNNHLGVLAATQPSDRLLHKCINESFRHPHEVLSGQNITALMLEIVRKRPNILLENLEGLRPNVITAVFNLHHYNAVNQMLGFADFDVILPMTQANRLQCYFNAKAQNLTNILNHFPLEEHQQLDTQRDQDGASLAHHYAKHGKTKELLEFLEQHPELLMAQASTGIYMFLPIHWAMLSNQKETVVAILKTYPALLKYKSEGGGDTLLDFAARECSCELFELFQSLINTTDGVNRTPIKVVWNYGNSQLIKKFGETEPLCLDFTREEESKRMARMLQLYPKDSKLPTLFKSPLKIACISNSEELFEACLPFFPDLCHEVHFDDLLWLCRNGRLDWAKRIFEIKPALLLTQTNSELLANLASSAVKSGNVEMVQWVDEKCPSAMEEFSEHIPNALYAATDGDKAEVVAWLLEKKTDLVWKKSGYSKKLPLQRAVKNGSASVALLIFSAMKKTDRQGELTDHPNLLYYIIAKGGDAKFATKIIDLEPSLLLPTEDVQCLNPFDYAKEYRRPEIAEVIAKRVPHLASPVTPLGNTFDGNIDALTTALQSDRKDAAGEEVLELLHRLNNQWDLGIPEKHLKASDELIATMMISLTIKFSLVQKKCIDFTPRDNAFSRPLEF